MGPLSVIADKKKVINAGIDYCKERKILKIELYRAVVLIVR